MKMIIGSSGTGKTRELVRQAAEVNGTVVCENVERMAEKIRLYGYSGLEIISYDEFISNERWKDITKKYFIKCVENLLDLLNVNACTVTQN